MDNKPHIKTIEELENMLWYDRQKYLCSLDKTELLELLDRRIRDNLDAKPNDYLDFWLLILRTSGVRDWSTVEQEGGWGEFEQLLSIFLAEFFNLVSDIDRYAKVKAEQRWQKLLEERLETEEGNRN